MDFAFPGGLQLCYIGIYAPSVASELHPLVARLQGMLSSACASGLQVIIAGDLNGVFDPSRDCIPGHKSSTPETVLMRLLSHHDLTDTYSVTHSDVYTLQAMTCINPANMSSGSCIDYILASPELALQVPHSQVVSVTGLVTDH